MTYIGSALNCTSFRPNQNIFEIQLNIIVNVRHVYSRPKSDFFSKTCYFQFKSKEIQYGTLSGNEIEF
jgi:hypothetical protein